VESPQSLTTPNWIFLFSSTAWILPIPVHSATTARTLLQCRHTALLDRLGHFFEIASFASSFRHGETFVVAKVASGHSVAVCRPSLLSPITPSPSSQGSPLVVLLSQDTFVFVKIRSQALHQIVVENFFFVVFLLYCFSFYTAYITSLRVLAR